MLLLILLAGEAPATADAALLPNYSRIRPDVAAAGQPSREGLEGLARLGFRTVVNLRREDEDGVKDERAIVEAQGLRYVSVPITAASLTRDDVAAVAKVLEDPETGPVLLHCTTSNRVGGVWALIEAARGRPLEDAITEGKKAGLRGEAMIEAVRRVAGAPEAAKGP
ncbi:MAG TPA: protein tyrosine phosphatase family protein [Vicinamibacteria bacterium]|nr:protein tyrosine phosphatase family protein [Vicinamibacteria bacterium]